MFMREPFAPASLCEVSLSDTGNQSERIALFSGAWFLYNFSYWMIMSYVPVHLTGLGLTRAEVGHCVATPQFLVLCTVLPFGYLSDRWAARRLSQIGLSFMILWAVALAVLGKGPLLLAAFALAGIGMPLHLVSFNALFLKHLGAESKGRKVGGFVSAQFAGFSLGPLATPAVQRLSAAVGGGPEVAFHAAGVGFACALGLTFLLRDAARIPFHLSEYREDVRSKRGMLVTAIILVYALHFGAEQAFYPTLLREQCGLTQTGVGVVFAYSGLLVGSVAFLAGRAFDRRQRMFSTLALCMVLSGVFQALTGLCTDLPQILGVRTLHTIADGTLNCYITLFVAVTFPQHRLGGNVGFVNAVRTVAIFLAAMVSGHLVEAGGLPMPFYVTGMMGAGAGLMFLALRPKLKPVMGEG
jgi:MFS family permease